MAKRPKHGTTDCVSEPTIECSFQSTPHSGSEAWARCYKELFCGSDPFQSITMNGEYWIVLKRTLSLKWFNFNPSMDT